MWKYDEKYGTLQKHKERLLAVSKPNQRWKRKWKYLVAQSCLTLCDRVDCSLPASSVHGILQARILEWVAFLSRVSSDPGNKPRYPALQVDSLPSEPPGKPFRWDWVKASWNFWKANTLLYRKTQSPVPRLGWFQEQHKSSESVQTPVSELCSSSGPWQIQRSERPASLGTEPG